MKEAFETARADCEALVLAYGDHADAWRAEALAELFTPDGVFDRLGTRIEGRPAIAAFIAGRPREFWQTHRCSGFAFELDEGGLAGRGTVDLVLERGKVGDAQVIDTVRARYHDRFVRTADGWRFSLREVQLLPA